VIAGKKQRASYILLRNTVISIQRAHRRAAAIRLQVRIVSAIRIQAWYRMMSVRKSYVCHRAAVVCLQRWWLNRKLSMEQRSGFVELRQSAVILQAAFRSYIARSRYLTMQKGFGRLAALVKSRQDRQRYVKLCTAVTYIGRWYRSRVAATTFARVVQLRRNHAARVMQTYIREYLDRQKEKLRVKQIAAALTIQRTFAMYMQRRRYLRQRQQVVIVQATVRRWMACRRLTRQRAQLSKSAVCLQAYARGFLCRKRLKVCSIILYFSLFHFFHILLLLYVVYAAKFHKFLKDILVV